MKFITTKHRTKIDSEVYVTLCGHELTLRKLIEMKCPSFIAARRLEKNLKKLRIKTIAELFKLDPYSLFNTRGIGVSQVFVAECLLHEYNKINPYYWYKKHLNPKKKRNHEI